MSFAALLDRNKYWLVILLSFALLFAIYHQALLHANDYLFSPQGDGIKNYYAYLFHAKYDTEFWNFTGMNYPYYEHMVYTDGHPMLSWLIRLLGLTDYGVGILNILMLISFPICAFFLLKILSHYGVKPNWAIPAAIVIAFMSPQMFRITGHFSLSYVFAIPALWWLLILTLKKRPIFWSIAITLYILIFFFTHPYLGLILCFFCLFFALVRWFWNKNLWKQISFQAALQAILPIIIFQLLVGITDTHENRVGQPSGFFEYYASWKSIFVPHEGPLSYLTKLFKINVGNWESWNYVGFSTTVFAWIILIYLIKNRKNLPFKNIVRHELAMFMLAAHLIVLFAFCFPLKYDFLRWIVDLFGPLKQFRVLGRFGWIFFYVFTIFSVVGLYKVWLKSQKKWAIQTVFYLGIVLYVLEFYPSHKFLSEQIIRSKNPFKQEHLSAEMKELIAFTKQGEYDALMFLPFTHLSSENILMQGTEEANYDAFLLSYHAQLPMMNSNTARMSLTEAIAFNNFFSPEFIEKDLVYSLPDSAKILVVRNKDAASPAEMRLIHSSNEVFRNSIYKAFEFDRSRWNTPYYFDEVMAWEKAAQIDVGNGWKSNSDSVWFIHEALDNDPSQAFGGTGSLSGEKDQYTIIYELDTRQMKPGMYTATFWYYLLADRPDVLAVAEQDSVGDMKSFWYDEYPVSKSNFIVDNWCFVTLEFEVSQSIEKINLMLTGNGNGEPFYVDELLIQRSTDRLFRRANRGDEEFVIYNNYWLRANSFKRK